jgi:hypothetical protein
VYGGNPIASLNRLVSASIGHNSWGGRSKLQVQVRRERGGMTSIL